MKIVHIIPRGFIEDRAYQENILPKKHRELGLEVHIITSQLTVSKDGRNVERKEIGKYINRDGVIVHVLKTPRSNIIRYLYGCSCIGIKKTLKAINPDIIFIHNVGAGENRYIRSFVSQHRSVQVFADCHQDYYNNPQNTFKQKVAGYKSRKNAKLIEPVTTKFWGTTPWRVDYLKDYYHIEPDKVNLLVMGGDEKQILSYSITKIKEDIRSRYGIPNNAFLVVTGGVIDKRKQQDLLMEAIVQLESHNVWLLVFGKPTSEMESICEHYSAQSNIIFAGWVDANYSNELFLASDMAIFPGTHSVLWEQAVACGVPQIIRRWKGMEHVNVNGNVYLLDEVNVDSLKAAIEDRLFTEEYNKMKMMAKEAAPVFYYDKIARKSIGLK